MDRIRRCLCCLVAGLLSAALAVADNEPETVVVGGYEFPPYVMATDPPSGATLDLIAALNRIQPDYRFRFREITANRRHQDFSDGRIDLLLFEQPAWSWQGRSYHATPVLAEDEELYIAHRRQERDQGFFDQLRERRIIGYLGYHYGFAGMESDERKLRENFNITLSRNHERNLQLILLDRPDVAEVAIVTRSFLEREMANAPEYRQRLLVSERVDQRSRLRGLLRPGSPLSPQRLDELMAELEEEGILPRLRERYRLQSPD
ncbi:MAG: hypothetical protein R3296_07035 [Oleiphilaceae bacterium]|nr:hypothetical protein [Oleiphilaceae bacterium]